ncbi:MAG: hypothetical protein ACJ73S_26155 [Mycobacteriales bacterium]
MAVLDQVRGWGLQHWRRLRDTGYRWRVRAVARRVVADEEVADARGALEVEGLADAVASRWAAVVGRSPAERRAAHLAGLLALGVGVGVLLFLNTTGLLGWPFRRLDTARTLTWDQFRHASLRQKAHLVNHWYGPDGGWVGYLAVVVIVVAGFALAGWLVVRAAERWTRWTAALTDAVLDEARDLLGAAARARGATTLVVDRAPGMRRRSDERHLVRPEHAVRLRRMVSDLGVSVVAVSGDRGVGKTTLLRMLSDPTLAGDSDDDLRMMVSAPVDYDAREFVVHLYLTLCRQVQQHAGPLPSPGQPLWRRLLVLVKLGIAGAAVGLMLYLANPGGFRPMLYSLQPLAPLFAILMLVYLTLPGSSPAEVWSSASSSTSSSSSTGVVSNTTMQAEAAERISRLRYQLTVSTERAGSLRVRALELSGKMSRQLAGRMMTFPELVQDYREFSEQVAAWWRGRHGGRGQVVVGIDEVDRIADAEQAERFLNEVKAIFGAPHCVYLVTVSEQALADFRRRAPGLRTAVENTFDDVLRLDALPLKQSLDLLERRVLGAPRPFLALCHCLAGGVPREMIRLARTLFQARQDTGDQDLDRLAAEVVRHEIDTLKHRLTEEAADLDRGDDTDALLERLMDPGWPPPRATELLAAARAPVTPEHASAPVRRIGDDLATALYLSATVLEVFGGGARTVVAAVYDGDAAAGTLLDDLAAVRRLIGTSPGLARRQLDGIRTRLGR